MRLSTKGSKPTMSEFWGFWTSRWGEPTRTFDHLIMHNLKRWKWSHCSNQWCTLLLMQTAPGRGWCLCSFHFKSGRKCTKPQIQKSGTSKSSALWASKIPASGPKILKMHNWIKSKHSCKMMYLTEKNSLPHHHWVFHPRKNLHPKRHFFHLQCCQKREPMI